MQRFRSIGLALLVCALGSVPALCQEGQQKVHLENDKEGAGPIQNGHLQNRPHLQAESIEIYRSGVAIPAEIHRPAGKFVLLLVNRTNDPTASFTLEPAASGEAQAEPILQLGDGKAAHRARLAALADLPAGDFHLKSMKTGQVLCRFRIE